MPSREPQQPADPGPSIYMPYGAEEGNYVFTDLAHLDRIIAKWTTLRDGLAEDGEDMYEAIQKIVPPADDKPSVTQAKAVQASLYKGMLHNRAMIDYMNSFLGKLQATRARYAATEETNTDLLRNADRRP